MKRFILFFVLMLFGCAAGAYAFSFNPLDWVKAIGGGAVDALVFVRRRMVILRILLIFSRQ